MNAFRFSICDFSGTDKEIKYRERSHISLANGSQNSRRRLIISLLLVTEVTIQAFARVCLGVASDFKSTAL